MLMEMQGRARVAVLIIKYSNLLSSLLLHKKIVKYFLHLFNKYYIIAAKKNF